METDQRINWPLWAFIVSGIAVLLAVPQDYAVEPRSLPYWATWLPALFSAFAAPRIIRFLCQQGVALAAFGVISSAWFLLHGDMRAVVQICALVWVTAWIATPNGSLPLKWIAGLVLVLLAAAIIMTLTGHNFWGVLPGQTWAQRWRVSLFPTIASTACFALIAVLILTKDLKTAKQYRWALAVAVYFLLLSQSRSVVLAAALYAGVWFVCRQVRLPETVRTALPLASVFVVVVALALVAPLIFMLQEFEVFSQLLLRGRSGLSLGEISAQIYRPWLWQQHLTILFGSPSWMGVGSSDFSTVVGADITGFVSTGSESFLTRLFASYGLPTVLFLAFLFQMYRRSTAEHDYWAYGVAAATLFMMFNYGSIFHPSSPINALFLFAVFRGSKEFSYPLPMLENRAERDYRVQFGLLDVLAVLLENKLKIVGGTLAVGVITYLTLAMTPQQYRAHAIVPLRSIDAVLIRSPSLLIEVASQTDVLRRNNGETQRALQEIGRNLTIEAVKGGHRVTVTSQSPDESLAILRGILAELRVLTRNHGQEMVAIRNERERHRKTLNIANSFLAATDRPTTGRRLQAETFTMRAELTEHVMQLEHRLENLRSVLDPLHPRRFVAPPAAETIAVQMPMVGPTVSNMVIFGVLFAIFAFGREYWESGKVDPAHAFRFRRARR